MLPGFRVQVQRGEAFLCCANASLVGDTHQAFISPPEPVEDARGLVMGWR